MFEPHKKHNATIIHRRIPTSFLITFLLIGSILAGCSPTATPTTEVAPPETTQTPDEGEPANESFPSIVRLPGGSEISLEPDTYLEIIRVSDLSPGDSGHEVMLHRGKIEVDSKLPGGIWFTVYNRDYYFARVTGSTMSVLYDMITKQFLVSCDEGTCELGLNGEASQTLETNQQGCIDEFGNFIGPFDDVDFDDLSELCVFEPQETETPTATETGTPTPSLTPASEETATAACVDFESQFPGTPCP